MSSSAEPRDVTDLLHAWSEGDRRALDELMPLVTRELRRLAERYLRNEAAGHTLQPTALVNELYLRLIDRRKMDWRNRAHFFAFASRVMRRLLVDHARAKKTAKRGSGVHLVALDEALDQAEGRGTDILALDDALDALSALDARQARIVELRVFAGLSLKETATVLDVSIATVSRDWASAKAWLYGELRMP